MENLSKMILRPFLFTVFILLSHTLHAVQDLIVYKVKGEPYVMVKDSVASIAKGSVLNSETTLVMKRDDELLYLDSKGEIFELHETGQFSTQELQQRMAFKENSTFTQKLFSYVWKELTLAMATRNNKSGVVYRGDALVLMRYPADSLTIYKRNIRFEWESIEGKEKDYFFILKDVTDGNQAIIGTPATSMVLNVDNFLLKDGHDYEWTITETKYPDSKTRYYSFKLGTEEDYKSIVPQIKEISATLKKLGLTKSEIREAICMDFKICY